MLDIRRFLPLVTEFADLLRFPFQLSPDRNLKLLAEASLPAPSNSQTDN